MRDTSPEAERVQAEVLRRLGPSRRLEIAIAMSEEARFLVTQRLHQQPNAPGARRSGVPTLGRGSDGFQW
jgi:hypothetical protein